MDIKATNFYVSPDSVDDKYLRLDSTESRHLAKVMRAQIGDIFYAVDGQGRKYQAMIRDISMDEVVGEIIKTTRLENEPLIKLTLAVGLSRPARIDFIVEKGTELGVSRFIFFTSEKTLVDDRLDKSASRKIGRWQKIAQAATKQSLRTVTPEIMQPVRYIDILESAIEYHTSLIADMNLPPEDLKTLLYDGPRDVLLVVGPESGLTPQEVAKSLEYGFKPIKLGPRRLRVETAAILFTSLVMEKAGEI